MRITAQQKHATRQRILDAASQLFRDRGFASTTTRDIATAASIATGTLFNYFAAKEDIVAFLAQELLVKVQDKFERPSADAELEEELFALVAAELRQLKPLRKFIMPALETSLSPLAIAERGETHGSFRVDHLEIVSRLFHEHGIVEPSPVAFQVYWALYTGVLAFWASDKSPKQEDTLALLDQSLAMFVAWLQSEQAKTSS